MLKTKTPLDEYLDRKEYEIMEKEHLRQVAQRMIYMGFYDLNDYYKFCEKNKLMVF